MGFITQPERFAGYVGRVACTNMRSFAPNLAHYSTLRSQVAAFAPPANRSQTRVELPVLAPRRESTSMVPAASSTPATVTLIQSLDTPIK